MKIAFVIYNLNTGGAERVVSLLSQELSKKHDVYILTFDKTLSYDYDGKLINLDYPSKSGALNKILNILKRTYQLKKIFKKEKFDKIFSFMETAYLPSILTGFPIIASVRNTPHKYNSFVTKNILSKAKKIVVVSKEIKDILNEDYNVSKTIVINNPIDFNYIEKMKKEPIYEENFIMAMGRLHFQKGFDNLINSYSQSNLKGKIKLFIFGEGSLRDELQELIDSKNLTNDILLKGLEQNPYKYLNKADFFILSSRYEGFPNALIEALAANKPVISTNCPTGPSEILNKDNGLLLNNDNELSKSMDILFEDKTLQEKFSKNAKNSVSHLSVEKISQKWIEL